jgi:ribosomal protein S4
MRRTLTRMLCDEGICLSMSEARRLCSMGCVRINGKAIRNPEEPMEPGRGTVGVGKRMEVIVEDLSVKK